MSVRLSNKDRLSIVSDLGTMLSAGIPILEAVSAMLEDAKGNQRNVLETLSQDLTQGKKISESFAKYPDAFDIITVNMIKAAEEAGKLETTLMDVKTNIKKSIEFNDKIKSALTYPAFVMVIFGGVLAIILMFVLPKIAMVFSRLRVDIPWTTRALINLSDFVIRYTLWIAIGLAVLTAAMIAFYIYKRKVVLNLFYSLPLISGLVHEIDLTRFARSLSLMLAAGIPIVYAMELCQQVVLQKKARRALAKIGADVSAGRKLSEGFRSTKPIFPALMIRITEAGEKTGTLDKSMQDISEYYEQEVDSTLGTLTTMLEPVMLVVIGLLVGGLMVSIIAPIYSMIGQIGGR